MTDFPQNLPDRLRDPEQYVDACDQAARYLEALQAAALEMTGHSDDPLEAFEQWQSEREALADFHANNEALKKQNDRLMDIRKAAADAIAAIRKEGVLFATKPMTKALEAFDDAMKQFDKLSERQAALDVSRSYVEKESEE